MKQFLLLSAAAFVTAALISSSFPLQPTPKPLTAECYISCIDNVYSSFQEESAQKEFQSWHPEPVSFNYVQQLGTALEFNTPDGSKGSGYYVASKKKTKNVVLVIQEWWGLNDHIKERADFLSKELGNAHVLALDMYDGKVASTRDSASKYVQGASRERLESIIQGAIAHFGKDSKIYTIGWCFGGMWSLQASLLAGNQAAGCVMFYGRPETQVERLKSLSCDVLGIFGKLDRSPSPEMVQQFETNMQAAGKKLSTHMFEAGHGFANPSNPAFKPEATEEAYKLVLSFLKERIR